MLKRKMVRDLNITPKKSILRIPISVNIYLILLILEISFLFVRCFRPVGGLDSFRQAQTVWPIKIWNIEGFSPLQPSVPIKGIEHQTWLLELPIYQWIIYSVNLIISIDPVYISRILSLLCALFIVNFLATQISDKTTVDKRILMILMITNPYMFYWMTTGLVDWLSIALGIVCGIFATGNRREYFLILSIVSGVLGSGIKPSHSLFGFLIVVCFKLSTISKKRLISVLIVIPSLMFFVSTSWQNWISVKYPLDDPRSIWSLNSSTFTWYFGTLDQYVHIGNNISLILDRLIPSFGGIALVTLCLIGYLNTDFDWKPKLLLILIPLMYTAVLINLNISHYYYQIPLAIVLSLIMGSGLIFWHEQNFMKKVRKEYIFSILIVLFFSYTSTGNNMSYIKSMLVNEPVKTECLAESEIANSTVLLVNWESPAFFYDCGIKSFQVNLNKNTDANAFSKEKEDYKYVYIDSNIGIVSKFIKDLNGELKKVSETEHWYEITWK